MTQVRNCLAIITAACLTSIGPVQADKLQEVEGDVWVNQGTKYDAGHSGMELERGAHVLTREGGSAVVKQRNGHGIKLRPNSRYKVGDRHAQYKRMKHERDDDDEEDDPKPITKFRCDDDKGHHGKHHGKKNKGKGHCKDR